MRLVFWIWIGKETYQIMISKPVLHYLFSYPKYLLEKYLPSTFLQGMTIFSDVNNAKHWTLHFTKYAYKWLFICPKYHFL